jgi:D-glycero-D-manno-heptose 1,7-bisphosphate phosphatase
MSLLILDRDGVVNEDSDAYIRSLEEWRPIPGSIAAIARLSQAGYRVVIATNQSGLGRGYFDLEALEAIHARTRQLVEAEGGVVSGIFYCPHTPDDGCNCRKPATGLLRAVERELGETALGAWFIGDSLKDLQAARAHGCRPLLVTTGKGAETAAALHSGSADIAEPDNIPVFDDLSAAATAIIEGAL